MTMLPLLKSSDAFAKRDADAADLEAMLAKGEDARFLAEADARDDEEDEVDAFGKGTKLTPKQREERKQRRLKLLRESPFRVRFGKGDDDDERDPEENEMLTTAQLAKINVPMLEGALADLTKRAAIDEINKLDCVRKVAMQDMISGSARKMSFARFVLEASGG